MIRNSQPFNAQQHNSYSVFVTNMISFLVSNNLLVFSSSYVYQLVKSLEYEFRFECTRIIIKSIEILHK